MAKINHVMIDIETMGLTPGAAIVSIGAVIFDPRCNRVTKSTFYEELDWLAQGRNIDLETKSWWEDGKPNGAPKAAQEALHGLEDLEEVLDNLTDYLPADCKVWGNGSIFDIAILENAYRSYDKVIPWEFWNVRDCRTIKDMYESSRGGWDKKMGGGKHNALQDAIYQAEYICAMWNSILTNS